MLENYPLVKCKLGQKHTATMGQQFNIDNILKGDPAEILKTDGDLIAAMSEEIRDNKKLALIAIKSQATAYICLLERLRNDPEIYTLAVKENGSMFFQLPLDKLRDEKLIATAIKTSHSVYEYARFIARVPITSEIFLSTVYASNNSDNLYRKMLPLCVEIVREDSMAINQIGAVNPQLAGEVMIQLYGNDYED